MSDIELPGRTLIGGYIYAIQFSTGVLKVGRTADPATRIAQHKANAETFGVTIARHWVSPLHNRFERTERMLAERAFELCEGRIRVEYFSGVDFDDLLAEAEQLFVDRAHLILPGDALPNRVAIVRQRRNRRPAGSGRRAGTPPRSSLSG